MAFLRNPDSSWKDAAPGALLCAGLGMVFLFSPFASGLVDLAYDLVFPALPPRPEVSGEVVMIYMDDRSFNELHQANAQGWDLKLHADLVDQMTAAGARVVVFDVVFNLPSPADAVARFAQAISRNGRVVLAAGRQEERRPGWRSLEKVLPVHALQEAAAMVGIAEVEGDRGSIQRQYYRGSSSEPSLPWAAARVARLGDATLRGAEPPNTRFNYYGPAETLKHYSYADVAAQPALEFTNKCVFIGRHPKTLQALEEADSFRTPYSRARGNLFPGVDLAATAFLNLLRRDGFVPWPQVSQFMVTMLFGVVCGGCCAMLRPWRAAGFGALLLAGLGVVVLAAARQHVWFAWTVMAFVQIPVGLGWSLRRHFLGLKIEKEILTRTLEETTRLVEVTKATASQKPPLLVPDHSLVRLIGRGAYGEVWLARNAIGAFHVVKIVKRRGFPSDEPYEREFRGIQKFMPISRSHPGFVHLLHVGRNDEEKFFYCVMEAGDDRETGQKINPETYRPRTLGSDMDEHGRLPPEQALGLGLDLTAALAHLHSHQLVHRDIKPPNIIYVNGAPKFADIGLVTDIESDPGQISQVGTEGYIAPEGPGTAVADVYALGMVLYEVAMGRDRRLFPEVPTAVLEQSEESLLRRLQQVIFRACERDPARRWPGAEAMRAELLLLLPGKPTH